MRRLKLNLFFLLLLATPVLAALNFPALTGRVVDDAHILSPGTIQSLTGSLADYEARTTNQVVVVTVKTLQGVPIENYGYQLGRAWGIGQKDKNNGVILLVAPKERKVRIEVGYGLEGELTDAMSSTIIQGVILPNFRSGHIEQGIIQGTDALLAALGGNLAAQQTPPVNVGNTLSVILTISIVVLVLVGKMIVLFSPRFYMRHPYLSTMFLMSGSSTSGGFSSDSSFGGFSGGGGGFGGGGSSGGW